MKLREILIIILTVVVTLCAIQIGGALVVKENNYVKTGMIETVSATENEVNANKKIVEEEINYQEVITSEIEKHLDHNLSTTYSFTSYDYEGPTSGNGKAINIELFDDKDIHVGQNIEPGYYEVSFIPDYPY